ncbi:aminomethyltransferase family protein [Gulosibacter chungangensis]|uniref:Aminomethyl transferase family protein n=1 Tax=Gulosibacter chungangensis TaxID=979746 RepID=A0A7J5B814_9MICO|nr:aminomethyltransferase family protein [Gulosibacter chungangensis]KAB1641227.1 aminomethyl transferase family protein [Gulosibacter chungangensis]
MPTIQQDTHRNTASLQQEIDAAGGPLGLLRGGRSGTFPFPIAPEFTNWRDEQTAWRESAALMDLSHHMTDLVVQGPDVIPLLSHVGANGFKGFGAMKAKQLIAVGPDGNMIGDAILFGIGENHVRIVGRAPALNWVQFNAEKHGYDVTIRRDERTVQNKQGRELYRLQLQGPTAGAIYEKVNGGPLPEIPFFHMGKFNVGKYEVTALNHRMSGFPGYEFFGPYEEFEDVRDTILEAGAEHGLRQVGGRAYASVATESGWIANTLPAYYSSAETQEFREWQSSRSFEATLQLGGSFVGETIEDYYLTPYDLGYNRMIRFDHDFIGREALERIQHQPHKKKVWIKWQPSEAARIVESYTLPGDQRHKYLEMPAAFYTGSQFDRVEDVDGNLIGFAMLTSYTANVRGWISLAVVDEDQAIEGREVNVVWGEPKGATKNPQVESHTVTKVRGVISDRPFTEGTQGSGA